MRLVSQTVQQDTVQSGISISSNRIGALVPPVVVYDDPGDDDKSETDANALQTSITSFDSENEVQCGTYSGLNFSKFPTGENLSNFTAVAGENHKTH